MNRFYELAAAPTLMLTARQVRVLSEVAAGLSHRGVGLLLGISKRTVDQHVYHLCKRLGAASSAQAVAIGMREGWIV